MLPDCLASLDGLVDRVEVLDTGSVDGTVALAERAGAVVHRGAWKNDFAQARNEVLAHCRDAWWVLSIDADERLVCDDPVRLRRRLATAIDEHRAFEVKLRDESDVGTSTLGVKRLFRTDGARWSGRLHEIVRVPGEDRSMMAVLDGIGLRHLGYTETVVRSRGKVDRNLQIARAAYEAGPSTETALHYARSLPAGDTATTALRRDLLEEAAHGLDTLLPSWQAYVLAELAGHALSADDIDNALRLAERALMLVPADDRAADMYGRAALAADRTDLVLDMAARRARTPSIEPAFASAVAAARAASREVAALATTGRVIEAYERASVILASTPDAFDADAWAALARAVAGAYPDHAVEFLLPVVLRSADDDAFDGIAHGLPAARLVELCVAYCDRGGHRPRAVVVGLVAALLKDHWDAFDRLCGHAWRLDADTVTQVADRAALRGAHGAVDRLRTAAGLPLAQTEAGEVDDALDAAFGRFRLAQSQ